MNNLVTVVPGAGSGVLKPPDFVKAAVRRELGIVRNSDIGHQGRNVGANGRSCCCRRVCYRSVGRFGVLAAARYPATSGRTIGTDYPPPTAGAVNACHSGGLAAGDIAHNVVARSGAAADVHIRLRLDILHRGC